MAFVPVPKTAVCHVIGELFSQVIENTLYFEFPADPLASEIIELASAVGGWAVTELCGVVSQDYVYRRTEAQSLVSESSPAYTDVVGTGTAGSNVDSQSAPAGTCLAVSFRTALGGRSYRGRNYVSGLPAIALEGNQVNAGFVTALVDAYEALPEAVGVALPDAVHVVVSRFHLGAPRAVGVTTPVLTYLATNRDVDSQRRRLTGRGS